MLWIALLKSLTDDKATATVVRAFRHSSRSFSSSAVFILSRMKISSVRDGISSRVSVVECHIW